MRRSHLCAGGYCGVVTTAWATVILQFEREQTLSRISALAADFEGIVAASIDANSDDEHDPEAPRSHSRESEPPLCMARQRRTWSTSTERWHGWQPGSTAFAVPVDARSQQIG